MEDSLLVMGMEGTGETAVVAAHFLLAFWGVSVFLEVAGLTATAGVGNHELSVLEQLRIGHYQKNDEKALTLYLKALNLGGWYYEPNIAEIFLENTQKQSTISHWKNFFEKSVFETDRYMNDETPLSLDIGRGVFKYFESVIKGKIPHVILDETVLRLKNHSIRFANENFSFYAKFKYHLLDEKLFIDFVDIFTTKRELSINELVEIRRKK